MNITGQIQPRCRTCGDGIGDTFYSLTGKLVKDNQRKTLADFLWDIARMDNTSDVSKHLPQQICSNCLRKLKVSFSFVSQIKNVNKNLLAGLPKKNGEIPTQTIDSDDGDKSDIDSIQNCHIECTEDHTTSIRQSNNTSTGSKKKGKSIPEYVSGSSICKSDCHTEMKSMLNKMMTLQHQINARLAFATSSNANNEHLKATTCDPSNALKSLTQQNTRNIVDMYSVKEWFPISSIEEAMSVEENIKKGRHQDVVSYLKGLVNFRGASVDDVLRFVFDDELAEQFNLEGRMGKMSLLSYDALLNCVRNVFCHLTSEDFIKLTRRYILLCHNRNKQKKYSKKKQNNNGDEEVADEDTGSDLDEADDIEMEEQKPKIGNSESELYFDEVFSEDSIMFNQNFGNDVKPNIFSNQDDELLEEEIIQNMPETDSNSVDGLSSCSIEESPKESTRMRESPRSSKGIKKDMSMISTLFPLSSQENVLQLEEDLKNAEFAEKIIEHIKGVKSIQGEIDKVLRCLFTDEVIADYNYEGRSGKHSLQNLSLVSTHVYSTFSELEPLERLKCMRRFVCMSHNRYKHIKRSKRKYNATL